MWTARVLLQQRGSRIWSEVLGAFIRWYHLALYTHSAQASSLLHSPRTPPATPCPCTFSSGAAHYLGRVGCHMLAYGGG